MRMPAVRLTSLSYVAFLSFGQGRGMKTNKNRPTQPDGAGPTLRGDAAKKSGLTK